MNAQLEEIRNAAIGDEVTQGTLEGFVEVQVGDHLPTRMSGAEIVVKDDVVVELRETPPEAEAEEAEEAPETQPEA